MFKVEVDKPDPRRDRKTSSGYVQKHNGSMFVRLKRRNWNDAGDAIVYNKESPPDGYKLVHATIQNRSKSGNQCNVAMYFVFTDKQSDQPFTREEAYEFFSEEENEYWGIEDEQPVED